MPNGVRVRIPLRVLSIKDKMKSIKEIVKDNIVEFSSYRNHTFYYLIKVDNDFYQFPVEREDIEGSTLMSTDKAITFMRWIRRSIKDKTFIKIKMP